MQVRDLAPLPTERGLIVGATGSGKTTLAKRLLEQYRVVIAIDPKGTLGSGERGGGHLDGYRLARTPLQLGNLGRRFDRVQYRPDMRFQNPADWERIYGWIYRRGKTFVYTDEVFDIMHWSQSPQSFRRCITSGRELGIGMLHATQRPRGIDKRVITEAERHYVFFMRDPDDNRYLQSRIGLGPLEEFAFWYTRDKAPFGPPKKLKLSL